MLPDISREELMRLAREDGEVAKAAKPFVDAYYERILERCCREFAAQEINYYQNIDNKLIFMLQLQIRMARDLQSALDIAINDGKQAEQALSEGGNGYA